MATPDENLVLRLIDDLGRAAPELARRLRPHGPRLAMAGIGLVIAIGSTGLLLGALTTGLASLVMQAGVPMVPAMNLGFFGVGTASLALGLLLAWKGGRPLAGWVAERQPRSGVHPPGGTDD